MKPTSKRPFFTRKRTVAVISRTAVVLLAIALATASAQSPNYSGQWKSTSVTVEPDPGYYSLPAVVMDIKHEGLVIEIRMTAPDAAVPTPPSEYRYTTDGKEVKTLGHGGGELLSRSYIENGKLIIEGEAEAAAHVTDDSIGQEDIKYVPYKFRDEYPLSEDGRTLTIRRKIERGRMTSIRITVLAKV